MNKIYKWGARLYMISTIIWAIAYLMWKYTKTVVVEETTTTMPIPILIILIILIAIVTIGGSVVILLTYWEQIKKDKLSFITFAPILLLMIGTIILGKLSINKVYVLVKASVEQFLLDIVRYDGSLTILLWILGSGLLVGALGYAYEKIYIQQP